LAQVCGIYLTLKCRIFQGAKAKAADFEESADGGTVRCKICYPHGRPDANWILRKKVTGHIQTALHQSTLRHRLQSEVREAEKTRRADEAFQNANLAFERIALDTSVRLHPIQASSATSLSTGSHNNQSAQAQELLDGYHWDGDDLSMDTTEAERHEDRVESFLASVSTFGLWNSGHTAAQLGGFDVNGIDKASSLLEEEYPDDTLTNVLQNLS
jgi:hypothetical protein